MCNLYKSTPRDRINARHLVTLPELVYADTIAPLKPAPFVMAHGAIAVGQWGMIPPNSKTRIPTGKEGRRMSTNNARTDYFVQAVDFSSQQVVLRLRTDNFGAETYWELRDDVGNVLDHGGNEAVGPDGGGKYFSISGGPGAYDDLAFIKDTLDLPAPGCYAIHFVDAYGDGMCCEFGSGFYRLFNLDGSTVPILWGGEFEAYDHRGFGAQGSISGTAAADSAFLDWQLFPNPASAEVHLILQLPAPTAVTGLVYNAQGQVIYRQVRSPGAGAQDWTIPVAGWPSGLYLLELQAGGQRATRSFVVQPE